LFFDGENLHVKGYIYAQGTRIIDPKGGNGYSLPDYLRYKFEDHVKVSDTLKEIFKDAGEILSRVTRSITDVNNLVVDDFGILAGFRENVVANLTPNVTRGPAHVALFKPGDIWEKTKTTAEGTATDEGESTEETTDNGTTTNEGNDVEATYIAIAYWNEIYPTESVAEENKSSTSGWSRTHDYSLAAIKGASMDIDAVAGTIEFKAENHINIKSGGNIYIAANEDVEIVGNESVNIGGTSINITASKDKSG